MSRLTDIFEEKCPKCGEGKVFEKKGNPLLFQMPKMYEHCSCGNHKFEREPGYFFGSMYVSYALAIAEMAGVFIITYFLFSLSFPQIVVTIGILAFLLSTFNFRLSRMLWIYMFDGRREESKV